MSRIERMTVVLLAFGTMAGGWVHAADVYWDGSENHDWDTAANWSSSPALPVTGTGTSGDKVRIDGGTNNYAVYTAAEGTRYYRTVEVGYNGDGLLHVTGGSLIGDDGGNYYIGRSGNTAVLNIGGGSCRFGASLVHVGTDSSSSGTINLSGGELVFGRESGGISGYIGDSGGSAFLNISGGTFQTRAGLILGYSSGTGILNVQGSAAVDIGIGANNSLDGSWMQNPGSTLMTGIDSGGITPIRVVDNGGGGGDVTFNNGALLEPYFIDGHLETNQWTVMTCDGTMTDNGLQFSTNVADYKWDYYVTNNTLVVTYGIGVPDPGRPQDLSALATDDQVSLDWTSVSGAIHYNIKRALVSGGPYLQVGTSTTNQFTDTGLTSRTEYFYVVSAETGEGESSDSDETSAITSGFVHPGGLFKQSDLERMRYQVQHRIDPWYTSFLELQAYSRSSYNYAVQGNYYTQVNRGGINGNAYLSDTDAAYCNALMWAITQDTRHADKCVEIFNKWNTLTDVEGTGGTYPLNAGLFAWKMVEAAEIIKSTYPGWNASDIEAFKDMLVYPGYSDIAVPASVNDSNGSFYWRIYMGDSGRHGNQDAICWRAMMSMGIFLDNEKMYQRALRYFTHQPGRTDDIPLPSGPSNPGSLIDSNIYFDTYNTVKYSSTLNYGYNGSLTNLFWENGQCQESSRDQAHTFFNLAIAAGIADVAWNQGDPVWTGFDHRLLKGFEFSARYNTSYVQSYPDQPTPWEPTGTNFIQRFDRSGRWFSKQINPHFESNFTSISRGDFLDNKRPIYEQAVAHFSTRMGLSTNDYLWTLRSRDVAIAHDGYETIPALAWIADQPGWGAITFRRPPLCAGDPVSGFSAGGSPMFSIHPLSGTVEAENYDWFAEDGEGHTYHDLTPTNTGGAYRSDAVDIATNAAGRIFLTDLEAGEWISYTVHVPADGMYGIKVRYAAESDGGTIRFAFGDAVETVESALPSTGSATDWASVTAAENVPLSAGVHSLRIYVGGVSNRYRLDTVSVLPMLGYEFSGNAFEFSWPSNHPGWHLEKSPALSVSNWIPIAGSLAGNQWTQSISGALGAEFFRLASP